MIDRERLIASLRAKRLLLPEGQTHDPRFANLPTMGLSPTDTTNILANLNPLQRFVLQENVKAQFLEMVSASPQLTSEEKSFRDAIYAVW